MLLAVEHFLCLAYFANLDSNMNSTQKNCVLLLVTYYTINKFNKRCWKLKKSMNILVIKKNFFLIISLLKIFYFLGEWEPPMIDNPEYKGEWSPKQIDNPAYKGAWVHPEIPNPEYAPDTNLYLRPEICTIGFDLWQVKAGTIFDNILVTDSIAEAKEALDELKTMQEGEKKMKEEQDKAERDAAKADEKEKEDDDEEDDDEDKDDEEPAPVEVSINIWLKLRGSDTRGSGNNMCSYKQEVEDLCFINSAIEYLIQAANLLLLQDL